VVVDYAVVESDAKTAKGRRSLALDPVTLATLKAHQVRQAEEKTADLRLFVQHTHAAGLPQIRLHDVRHSYATAALAAGVPPKVISQRLGHATIAITMDTYSHVIPGLDEQAAETVAV
jgi:integrase